MKFMIKPWVGVSGTIYYPVYKRCFLRWVMVSDSTANKSREQALDWLDKYDDDMLNTTYHEI